MPLKKTVAMERRIDLASLFCMIARHGPAVLLTLAGIGCVVAGLIFFKRVRNKRRRRAAVAERRGSSAGSRDEALGGGSTDVSDESSLDDAGEHMSMSHGQVRQRRAASERMSHKHNAPDKDAAIDKAQHSFFWEWNSHRTQNYGEEAVNNLDNKGYNEEYVNMLTKDVGNQKHQMPEADSSDDITTSNEDVSEGYFRREDSALDKQEETVRRTYNSQSCFCPTSGFKVDDRKDTNSQPLDSTPESDTSSVSVKENHSTALQKDHVTLDQANDMNVGHCISRSLNTDKQTDEPGCDKDISTVLPVELKEELVACPKSETEPSTLEETKDVHFETSETTHITNVSPEGQESATPASQKLEAPIDQSGHYPHEQSHHSTEVQSDKDVSSCPKDIEKESLSENIDRSIQTEVISHSLNISAAVGESAVELETAENFEIETILPDDACLQGQPSPKDASQAQEPYADNLSDQNDANETLPLCKENHSNDSVKVESIDSRHVDGCAQPESIPNLIPELLHEETSPSDVPADVKAEIQSTTKSTTSSNSQKADAMTQHLETETPRLCNEGTQADQGADTDTTERPTATINNKIDCIVEQIVADAYIEVRQKTMHMEDSRPEQLCVQPALDSDCIQANVDPIGIDKDAVNVCTQESKEVVFCSNMASQITEEVVNAVCSLEVDKEKILESGNQKDLTHGASDSFSDINVESIDVPTVTADPLVQKINGVEEKTQGPQDTFNNLSIPSAETSLDERPVVDVKSLQIDETVSVDSLPDKGGIDNDFAKDPIHKAVELENCSSDVDVGRTSIDLCQVAKTVNDVEKVESEDPTETKTETVENLATLVGNNQCETSEMPTDDEQSKVEVVNPADNRSELKVCDKAEVLEITPSAQTEEAAMSADSHNGVSSHIEKTGCKVVIVCRTLESSVSAVEFSDDEDIDCISSHLELNSNSECHDRNEDKRTSANEDFSVVTSSDTVAANEQTEDTSTHTNKRIDLTSVALDIGQDNGAAMKPAEQIKHETCVSSHSLESGIYSMTVSPETEEASVEVGKPEGDLEADLKMYQEEKISHINEVCTATKTDEVTTVQRPDLQLEYEDISDESLVTNEDSFGSEIEDGYQEAMEKTILEVVQNITSVGVDMTQVEVKSVDNVKKQASAIQKEEEKADSEKTDISIMEATMDHNEWIIDGSYQMLPWMTATSSSTSNKEGQGSVEIEPPPQTSTTDDSSENAKKVLAVQPMPQNVNVTFRVHYLPLSSDQTVAVTGDQQELGAWKTVVPLEKSEDGYWSCVVGLPVDSHVEWKFVVLEKGEVCRWEECGNRLLFTGCGEEMLVYKWWGIL